MHCISFIALAALIAVAAAAPSEPHLQARKNVDRPDPFNLDHCPGRPTDDADKCTFEKQVMSPAYPEDLFNAEETASLSSNRVTYQTNGYGSNSELQSQTATIPTLLHFQRMSVVSTR